MNIRMHTQAAMDTIKVEPAVTTETPELDPILIPSVPADAVNQKTDSNTSTGAMQLTSPNALEPVRGDPAKK